MKQLITILLLVFTPLAGSQAKTRIVRLETSAGVIRVELSDDTPKHHDNFLRLVEKGYYDGLLFHRVIKDFMIQGGDPDSRVTLQNDSVVCSPSRQKLLGDGGPGYTLPAEFQLPWLFHVRGALAAAREPDETNPQQRSSGSQFYIVWGRTWGETSLKQQRAAMAEDGIEMNREMWNAYLQEGGSPHLDGKYTVFGNVISGLKVVKAIQAVATDKDNRPLEDVVILRAIVER